jgi:L-alanine-DL-glutamate epimerase-like enolase superfamily enzyme
VAISDGNVTGYGEVIPYPFYGITNDKIQQSFKSVNDIINNALGKTPEQLWEILSSELKDDYFSLCALDCAYWDYYAKSQNRTIRSYFVNKFRELPLSNFTIGIDTVEIMIQKMKKTPWPIYKIKLGTEHDVDIVSELRKNTDAIFRIDANCAWGVQETLDNAVELKELGVEFLEQPLQANNWEGMKILKEQCVLPIIADESCQRFEDVEPCAEVFDGINLKLMKCGGITPALRMIELARSKGIKVMAGCMTESSVGISNLVQIAPFLDYIDADGALLLKEDIAEGATLDYGKIIYSESPGSGVKSVYNWAN